MTDEAFVVFDKLWDTIHDAVDAATEELSLEEEDSVREKLGEEFRFWRRMPLG